MVVINPNYYSPPSVSSIVVAVHQPPLAMIGWLMVDESQLYGQKRGISHVVRNIGRTKWGVTLPSLNDWLLTTFLPLVGR